MPPKKMAVSLSPGQRLGPYEIVALLGSGGMGEAYRQRFQREARAASALCHPNILDFGLARQTREGEALLVSGLSTEAHTQAGTVMGTVPYMSPEQALGMFR